MLVDQMLGQEDAPPEVPRVIYTSSSTENAPENATKTCTRMSEPTQPTQPTQPPTLPAGGRKSGRGNYTREEMMNFLSIMEVVLPIGGEEWDEVFQQHTATGYPGRDTESIRRKYGTLHRKPIPTGDPSMPDEVRLAKKVKYKIGDKANIGDGEEEYDLENANFGPEEEEDPVNAGLLGQPTQPTQTQEEGTPMPTRAEVILPTPRARTPPPRTRTPTLLVGSASQDDRRDRRRGGAQDDFLELYRLQMVQESESRKALVDSLGLIATSIASALGKKKRKRTIDVNSNSSKRTIDVNSNSSDDSS
jgi:hypothetical protein